MRTGNRDQWSGAVCEALETRRVMSPLPYPAGAGNLQARLVGAADFNADGGRDLLWQNHNNGDIYIEVLTGVNTFVKNTVGTVPDGQRWTLVGIADVNGDGSTPDLIWFDNERRIPAYWRVENLQFQQFAYINSAPIAPGWRFQATGDFDGDGDAADHLWRNFETGRMCVWSMSLGTAFGGFYIFDGPKDLNWTVELAHEFNLDGKPDLVWRNYATGQNAVWTMDWRSNGANPTNVTMINRLNTAPQAWDIEAIGDFNNDNLDDIVWRNYNTGQVLQWNMNGTVKTGEQIMFIRAD
jgi:hypothetical protein